MATVDFTSDGTVSGKIVAEWSALAANDDGDVMIPQAARPLAGAVQFSGTFGGTVTLQKSNDGVTWYTMKDLDSNDLAVTAAGLYEFSTAALYIRPIAGTGVSAVTVKLVLRG